MATSELELQAEVRHLKNTIKGHQEINKQHLVRMSNLKSLLHRCKGFLSDPHPGLATWLDAKEDLINDIDLLLDE